MSMTRGHRRLDGVEGRFPAPSPAMDLSAIVSVMTPADRATWDRISTTYDQPSDDPLGMLPDDYGALVEVLSRTLERLGVEVDEMWRQGLPTRYRSDYRRYRDCDAGDRDRPVGLDVFRNMAAQSARPAEEE